MASRNISIIVRAQGTGHAISQLDRTAGATRRLGDTVTITSGRLGALGRISDGVGRSMSAVATGAKRASLGVLGMATIGAKVGLDFNSRMEQSTVALTNLLGSRQQAQSMLHDLYGLAARTPFETQPLVASTQRLLGFGMAADRVLPTMTAIGDAVAGVGGGSETIDRVATAMGQIQAKGKVSSEELLQLAEAGVPAFKLLGDQLGLTGAQLSSKLQAGAIDADKGISALVAGMESKYRGMAAQQSKTFAGQISSLKDYASMTLGAMTEPLFKALERDVLPAMTRVTKRINTVWSSDKLTLSEKLDLTGQALRPVLDDLVKGLKGAQLDRRLSDAFKWAMPAVATAVKTGAPALVKALWEGWKASPWWAKMLEAGFVLRALGFGGGGGGAVRSGPFGTAGGMAAKVFRGGFQAGLEHLGGRGGVIGKVAAFFAGRGNTMANPLYVFDVAGHLPGKKVGGGILKKTLDVGKRALPAVASRLAPVAPLLPAAAAGAYAAAVAKEHRNLPTRGPAHARREEQAVVPRGAGWRANQRRTYTRQDGPAPHVDPKNPFGLPPVFPHTIESHITVEVDGKALATTVHRQAVRAKSTR